MEHLLSNLCRVVQLASPSLNYFIVVGAALMYMSAYLDVLPSTNEVFVQFNCTVSIIA